MSDIQDNMDDFSKGIVAGIVISRKIIKAARVPIDLEETDFDIGWNAAINQILKDFGFYEVD